MLLCEDAPAFAFRNFTNGCVSPSVSVPLMHLKVKLRPGSGCAFETLDVLHGGDNLPGAECTALLQIYEQLLRQLDSSSQTQSTPQ